MRILLRSVKYNYLDRKSEIEKGITCCVINGLLNIYNSFWGKSEVWGNDTSKLIMMII